MLWYIAGMEIVERNHALVFNMFFWTILAFVILMLRLYTRAVVIRHIGADDYLMVGALVASVAWVVGLMFQIHYGLGRPLDQVILIPFMKSLLATVPLYNVAQTCYKISIAVQSYSIFSTTLSRKIIKGLIVWIFACGILAVTISCFYCFPVAKAWDDSLDGWCLDRTALYYTSSAINIFNDLFLISLPFPFLLKLQVAHKQRVLLCSVFSCGVIVAVVSISRLKSLHDYLSGPVALGPISGIDIALWSQLEINLAIICGSVPALTAFVSKVILGHGTSNNASAGSSRSRRKSRNQSQSLDSGGHDEEQGGGGHPLAIIVHSTIESKSYQCDDQGSERGLVARIGSHGSPIGNVTVVSGPSVSRQG